MEELLRAQWRTALPLPGTAATDAAFDDLMARYREPQRRYHTVAHLARALDTAVGLLAVTPAADGAAVRLALFFHDAVYEPAEEGNEAASAGLARRVLEDLGVPAPLTATVGGLVLATADHTVAPPLPPGAPRDERGGDERPGEWWPATVAVVLDADLAVLAAEPAVYAAYVDGVRAEYAHIDDASWQVGRAAVLQRLLAQPVLYRTSVLRAREARARANLTAELADLTR